jgi:predicted nicotinamide N-methyase
MELALQRVNEWVELFVPELHVVQTQYLQQKEKDPAIRFPHWARLWPASLAMTEFLLKHRHYIQNKKVLELAAGLGLPSLVAARYAQHVCCSDYLPEAVTIIEKSVQHNQLVNVDCRVLNWHHLPIHLQADVLLLSDINYDPAEFEQLFAVLHGFLQKSTLIVLSTPQRLMAKPFIEQLLPWCRFREEIEIFQEQQTTPISILVLQS